MTRFRYNQSSFALGEISDEAAGRVDLEELKQGAKRLENFSVTKTAGARKRPGSRYVTTFSGFFGTMPTTGGPILIPFIVSKKIAYIIAIRGSDRTGFADADSSIQIFKNDYAGTKLDLAGGELTYKYAHIIASTLDTRLFSHAQNGDQLFITHASGTLNPIVITRTAEDNFTIANVGNAVTSTVVGFNTNTVLRTPFRKNVTPITLTPSALAPVSGTLTASDSIFEAGHVGILIKITHGATTGVARITGFVSPTVVNIGIITGLPFGAITASDNWSINSWSDVDGYPTAVGFYEGRSVWGGTTKEPGKLSISAFGNIFHLMEERLEQDKGSVTDVSGLNFFGDIVETDPFSMELANKEANQIGWIDSNKSMQVGTLAAEFSIRASEESNFSILSNKKELQSSFGSRQGKVVRVGDRILFISRTGRSVRDYKLNRRNGSFVSQDMNLMHNEIHKHGTIDANDIGFISDQLVDLALQAINDLVWFVNARNELVTLTVSDELKTIAWARYTLAGTNVNVWGIAAIPNETGDYDDMYISLERTVNGAQVFVMEKVGQPFDEGTIDASADLGSTTIEDSRFESLVPIYLDSHIREISASTKTTMGGLGHLDGEDVVVCINGARVAGTFTVASGSITGLPSHDLGDTLIAGLLYEAEVILLDPDVGANDGDAQGATKAVDRVDLEVIKTLGLKISVVGGKFIQDVKFDAIEVETGLKSTMISGTPARNTHISIKSTEPYPCTIVSAVLRGVTYD